MTSPSNKQENALARHLEAQAEGRRVGKQMTFDPTTGRLSLVPRRPPGAAPDVIDADAIVVDQIAETGFFAKDVGGVAVVGVIMTSAGAGGGTAGAGAGAAIGMACAGPPGAAVGFLVGLAAGTAAGAAAGQQLSKGLVDQDGGKR
ncbi:MAG: hypothetical protein OHK0013_01760 [Sandaracinaceae bacterium]